MCEPNQLKRLNEEAAFASWQESEIAALKEKLRAVEAERDEAKRETEAHDSCNDMFMAQARAELSALRAELERKDAALKEARLACVVRAQIAEEAISAGYAHGSGHLPTKERGADSLEKCRRDLNAALQPKEPPCKS